MSKPKHKLRKLSGRTPSKPASPRTRANNRTQIRIGFAVVASLALVAGSIYAYTAIGSKRAQSNNSPSFSVHPLGKNEVRPRSLSELMALAPDDLVRVDTARMHLLCAVGLPGSEKLDIEACLSTLDGWAAHVESETDRLFYQFRRNPKEFYNSEGYFRMLVLNTVIQQDYGVHYNPERIDTPDFKNAKDQFISGMVNDTNGGTCASMPVLLTVIARRLGYPVRFVTAKAHLFCRWDAPGDRINIEGSGVGMNSFPDEYYKTWPLPVTDEEIARDEYLKSLSVTDELAMFLVHRGNCLLANKAFHEAEVAYADAVRVKPGYPMYQWFLADARREAAFDQDSDVWVHMPPQFVAQTPRPFPPPPNQTLPGLLPTDIGLRPNGAPQSNFPSYGAKPNTNPASSPQPNRTNPMSSPLNPQRGMNR